MDGRHKCALGLALVGGGFVAGWWLGRGGPALPPGGAAAAGPASFADVVERAAPAIVAVRARLRTDGVAPMAAGAAVGHTADTHQPEIRHGSGFVVDARGLVVTSRHVVLGAVELDVVVPQHGTGAAVLVGEDPANDLALLRLVAPPRTLAALRLGDSRSLRAGDWIVAVGNPLGFAQTVTAGVVSFVGRHLRHSDLGVTSDYLQFSAPVNPGSSGGPVLDLAGRVVGVTTQAAAAAQGISFAVPSQTLRWALEAMERHPDGRARRGYLGIEFASRARSDDLAAAAPGVVIVRVAAGEPGDRAGLRRGDVVLRLDGESVLDAEQLHEQIVRREPGTRLVLALLRDGSIHEPVEAVLGEVGGSAAPDAVATELPWR
ncbi:MAG: trypsin-like peptidase domain-containing protein [Planctomycetes bacterium]|nr:trypsin-like peptidase domain-containing protein [Planctomycetota bacterium]